MHITVQCPTTEIYDRFNPEQELYAKAAKVVKAITTAASVYDQITVVHN